MAVVVAGFLVDVVLDVSYVSEFSCFAVDFQSLNVVNFFQMGSCLISLNCTRSFDVAWLRGRFSCALAGLVFLNVLMKILFML